MKEFPYSLREVFGPDGLLAKQLPEYEYRSSQLEMAKGVLKAIEQGDHLCVEAGTGTGKTLAYLIPALFSRKRVIVSTATRNLQDQLFYKDIPFIQSHVMPDLFVTYMKGRNNYLCLKRLKEQAPQILPMEGLYDEWMSIAKWALDSETGDRSELEWLPDQDPMWNLVDARSEACVGQKCDYFDECFVTRMRRRALESDLIVVNHALFFANLALEKDEIGKILPDFSVLILDEAHELEDSAASFFGTSLSSFQFEEFGRDARRQLPGAGDFQRALPGLLEKAERFFGGFPPEEGRFSLNFFRRNDGEVTDLRDSLGGSCSDLRNALLIVNSAMEMISDRSPEWEPLSRRLLRLLEILEEIFLPEDENHVYWFERRRGGVFLHVTPIDVAPILRDRLFSRTDTTILTSATLTTNGNFQYVKERLGVPDPIELIVPGEFDYSTQTILYVPRALPSPRSTQFHLALLREIRKVLEISEGSAFLLFTSFQQMHRVHQALARDLPYPLLLQGEMPKNRLLERFKSTPRCVLCATYSFWQGVDVRGDALRAVVIDKLPFQVPTEPIIAARLHRLENEGENAFLKYSIPEAIITLKQGLGRLIRSRSDRGILAIMDSRLRNREYGELFLKSLPNCPVTDNMNELRNFFQQHASPANGGS